jgi:hypothetical protein
MLLLRFSPRLLRAYTTTATLQRNKPTIAMAKEQISELWELDNHTLLVLSRDTEAHDVHQERLIRDIMGKDGIEYDQAANIMKDMFEFNQVHPLVMVPYDVTFLLFGVSAVACVPLVFYFDTAKLFADAVSATLDVEEIPTLHSASNVGAWTWTWMEPMIGTASFSILCLQLARTTMKKLEYRPYFHSLQSKRANDLACQYPRYTKSIVKDFGRSQPLRGEKYNPLGRTW